MRTIEATVSFDEYMKERRGMGGMGMEDALMTMFKARGILMDGDVDMKPREPVTLITDPVNKVFVMKQTQLSDGLEHSLREYA